MKKILALILVMSLSLFALVGCDTAPTGDESSTPPVTDGQNESGEENEGSEGHAEGEGHEEGGEEADPASPVMSLSEPWKGVIDGMEVDMSYDETSRTFSGTVKNVAGFELQNVLVELNMKQGETTVFEVGPFPLDNMAADETKPFEIKVDDEPDAEGETFDAWQVHMEADNAPKDGTVNVGNLEEGEQLLAEGLAINEPFIKEQYGVRTELMYNESTKAFEGTVTNITNGELTDVRTEIHLDNGSELGPTPRITLAAGETQNITLDASSETNYSIYVAHTEVANTEHVGEENGGEGGNEEGGEH